MRIAHAEHTSIGKVRIKNEDSFGFCEKSNFYFVCDGMGGHIGGDFASQTTVDSIKEILSADYNNKTKYITSLQNVNPVILKDISDQSSAILLANRRLFNIAREYPYLRGMGTTIAFLCLTEGTAYTLHAGDSRVYLIRGKSIQQLTRDHSWVNELLEDKEITAEEAKKFKKKNVVTRVLGTQACAKIDCGAYTMEEHDIFLLCSDGLTGHLPDNQIRDLIVKQTNNLQNAAQSLIDTANNAGGNDNITAMLVQVTDLPKNNASIDRPILDKPVTITDNHDKLLDMEDEIIQHIFINKPAVIPEPPAVEKKSLKKHLPAVITIVILLSIFISSLAVVYRNITSQNILEKHTLIIHDPHDSNLLTGYLEIVTDPSGAEVYVSGSSTPAGLTPLTLPFKDLDPEQRNMIDVHVKKYGYKNERFEKEVIINDTITITLSLKPESLIEIYLGIEADFAESSLVFLSSSNLKNGLREISTIGRLKNLAYQGGLPKGEYELIIKQNEDIVWSLPFKAYKNRKAKIYIGNEKGIESINYEDF
ncbi:MAG: Stp1/IreP family PP2C-type Ser/Thr phosphatase [bacterium]